MPKKPITAADMARLRVASQTPERRAEIAAKAGRASWDSLTLEQQQERTRKMLEARMAKAKGARNTRAKPRKRTALKSTSERK